MVLPNEPGEYLVEGVRNDHVQQFHALFDGD